MRKVRMLTYGLVVFLCIWAIGTRVAGAQVKSQDPRVALMDNCDPTTFNGLCVVLPRPGDTTLTEFFGLLFSPLSTTIIGHPAWRFEPSYLDVRAGQTIRVTNTGGEAHTFTEVADYGGGFVPILNGSMPPVPPGTVPLALAPKCALVDGVPAPGVVVVSPGGTMNVKLTPGVHKFQCCIHPWMRASVDVE